MPSIASNATALKSPFLSVVIRTQGKRIECLKEALLCLTAQSEQDFEVVLVQHGPKVSKAVQDVINLQPETLKNKIRVLAVLGGKRAVPLNAGVRAAQGSYVAFYDDDDLLFANWVEEFKKQSNVTPENVLRSQVATLKVQVATWSPINVTGLRTSGWPQAEYAKSFSHVDHLLVNHSPFMGLAFPRTLFTELGLSFDESLTVCEDWDFLLRASSILPVSDVNSLTALYRRWEGQETSYTAHDEEEWRASEQKVISKISASPLTIRGDDVSRIRQLLAEEQELHSSRHIVETYQLMLNSLSWRITQPLRAVRSRIGKKKS